MNARYLLIALLCLGLAGGTAFADGGATPGSDQTDAAGNPVTGSSTESGWAGDAAAGTVTDAAEIVVLTFDGPASAAGGALQITWLDVNDSRCPGGVACFWEGEVSITIAVAEENGRDGRYEIALREGDGDRAVVAAGAYAIGLVKVVPYPIEGVNHPRSDYEALLTVSPVYVPGTDDVLPGEPGDPDIGPDGTVRDQDSDNWPDEDWACGADDATGLILDDAGNCVDAETGEVWPADQDGSHFDRNGDGILDRHQPCDADDPSSGIVGPDGSCTDPGTEPWPDPRPSFELNLDIFRREMSMLAEWGALTGDQAEYQVIVFMVRMGFDVPEPAPNPDTELTEEQQKLVGFAQRLTGLVNADGWIPWDEIQIELAHVALELGLIEEGQVDPIVHPRPEPPPDHGALDLMVEVFHEELWHLVEWGALREDQLDWQIIAFRMELGVQDAIMEPPEDAALDEAQEELVAFARELARWVAEDGQIPWEEIKHRLGMMGVELGLVDASLVEEPHVRPPPDPTEIRNRHIVGVFHEELEMLTGWGALLPHQAEWLVEIYAAQLYGHEPEPLPADLEVTAEQEELAGQAWRLAHLISDDGQVPWEEIVNRLADVAADLGLIDESQVRPTRPPERSDPLLERSRRLAGIFERNLSQLTEWNLLTDAQHERALAEFLFEVGLFPEDKELPPEVEVGPELAELLAAVRETAGWISEDGEVRWDRIHHHLASVAAELGLIDESLVVPPVHQEPGPEREPRYRPGPEEVAMIGLLRELAVQMANGDISADEAWQKLTAMAAENGWTEIDVPAEGEGRASGATDDQDAAYAGGNELLALRSDLALQVSNRSLSGEEALNQLSETLDSLDLAEADGDEGTVIQETSWGAIKSMFSR